MTPERWQRVESVFRSVLEKEPSERRCFLDAASGDDSELLGEISSVLASHEQAGSFLDDPIVGMAGLEAPVSPATGANDNAPIGQAHNFLPGQMVGDRFQVVRFLAEGGMGEVYEVWDTELREKVALKTLRQTMADNEEAEERFLREIQLARRVTHPNVCRIFDLSRHRVMAGRAEGEIRFLTMELLPGETLAERLRRVQRLSVEETVGVARQVAAALKAAHDAGIVHRDLKPDNVMLVPSERGTRAVVTDFGLAGGERRVELALGALPNLLWTLHEIQADTAGQGGALGFLDPMRGLVRGGGPRKLTRLGQVMGTPAYMSPEQIRGVKVDHQTDVWSFGVVLFEMLTGRLPYTSEGSISGIFRRLTGKLPSPGSLGRWIPRRLRNLVLKCLQIRREFRFRSVDALIEELERVSGEITPADGLPPKPWRLVVLAALALLVLVSLAVVFL